MVAVDADHVFTLPDADADSVFCESVNVVASAVGNHILVASVTYTNERNMLKTASAAFTFLCQSPFAVSASVAATSAMQMMSGPSQQLAASVMLNTAVMLGVTLTVSSPDSIIIDSACLAPNPVIMSAAQSNSASAGDSIAPLHSAGDHIAPTGCDIVLPFLVAFRSYSSSSCGTLRLVWKRAHPPKMHLVSSSASAASSPDPPPSAVPLSGGSVIPSRSWLTTHAPQQMDAAPVHFRAPMPCPACYSSSISIDLLLPSKVAFQSLQN
jgi:hypothetical protein